MHAAYLLERSASPLQIFLLTRFQTKHLYQPPGSDQKTHSIFAGASVHMMLIGSTFIIVTASLPSHKPAQWMEPSLPYGGGFVRRDSVKRLSLCPEDLSFNEWRRQFQKAPFKIPLLHGSP